MIPVHATVIIFEFSISPELTITGGRGAMSAPPRHFIFAIVIPFLSFCGDSPHTLLGKLFEKSFSETFQKLSDFLKVGLVFLILSHGGKNVNKARENLR